MITSPTYSPLSPQRKKSDEKSLSFIQITPVLKGWIKTMKSINSVNPGETSYLEGDADAEDDIIKEEPFSAEIQCKKTKV